MDPITTPNSEETTPATDSIADPVVLFPLGEEQYQLVYDFNTNKSIARHLNINPMMQGLDVALSHPDGVEVILWACLSQMGPKHQVPKEQRHLKLKSVVEWLEDPDTYFDAVRGITDAFRKWQPKQPRNTGAVKEDEDSVPPQS